MSLLKTWKKKPGSATDDAAASQPTDFVETPVQAKRHYLFGRVLSFAIAGDSIEMAAAQRTGLSTKLIDTRKVYFGDRRWAPEDRTDHICGLIQEYVTEHGGRKPVISLVVSGQETALRTFEMPALKGSQLRSAIQFEAKKRLPFPAHDCLFDYRVTARVVRDGKPQLRISLIGATKRLLWEHLDYFRRLELPVAQVYCAYDAIGQLLPSLPEHTANEHYALLNIEPSGTHLSYFHGANLEFYHITGTGSNFLASRTDDSRFEDFAEMLGREIQNSLDYYSGQYSNQFRDEVYIYGDLAYTDDLVALLDDQFGFKFRRFPVGALAKELSLAEELRDSLPVGLATVAAALCSQRLANLLPEEQQLEHRRRLIDRLAIAALVLLTGMLGLQAWSEQAQTRQLERELTQVQTSIETFEQSNVFDTYKLIKQRVALGRQYFDRIKPEDSFMGLNLKEISRAAPPGMQLTIYEYEPFGEEYNMYMSGVVRSSTVPPELILAEYIETLSASPLYQRVAINRHVKRARGDGFELEFRLGLRGIV